MRASLPDWQAKSLVPDSRPFACLPRTPRRQRLGSAQPWGFRAAASRSCRPSLTKSGAERALPAGARQPAATGDAGSEGARCLRLVRAAPGHRCSLLPAQARGARALGAPTPATLPGVAAVPVDSVAVSDDFGARVLAEHTHPEHQKQQRQHLHVQHHAWPAAEPPTRHSGERERIQREGGRERGSKKRPDAK